MRKPRRVLLAAPILAVLLAASPAPGHLEHLRLLPPVVLRGEKGWSLEERMRHYKVEGVSVAVFRDFRVVWTEARGFADRETKQPATPDTLFQAGSISKPVAATAVLRKVEAGELDLGHDVNAYLKSWKLPESPASAGKKATLERILSHSAGLTIHGFPGYAVGEPVPTVPQVLDGAPPANTAPVRIDIEPGTQYRYSGGGYTIAQLALTDVIGKPFPDLMRQLVLEPAGMTSSTYAQPLPPEKLRLAAAGYRRDGTAIPGKRHTYPEMAAAGLWTTAGDLARFAIAIGRSIRGESGALLSKEMASRMTTRVKGDAGLGLFLDRHQARTSFGHDGADEGFQALLIADREGGFGAAVMVNSDNGINLAEEILRGIEIEYEWGYLPPPVEVVKLPPADLDMVSGRYEINGDDVLPLSVTGGRLLGRAGTPQEFELHAVNRDRFVRKDREIVYEIERGGGGVTGVRVVAEGGTAFVARRVAAEKRYPSEDLAAGRIEEALAGYRKLFAEKPSDQGASESRLNNLGYQLAAGGERPKALAILRLNTELYPGSSNTYDSLAEVSLDAGDRAGALAASRRVLEVLPGDSKANEGARAQLRANAEKRIRELYAPAGEKK